MVSSSSLVTGGFVTSQEKFQRVSADLAGICLFFFNGLDYPYFFKLSIENSDSGLPAEFR